MVGLALAATVTRKDPGTLKEHRDAPELHHFFLGFREVAGGLGVRAGILTELAAFGLILVMRGAIQKKIFAWHTGFRGEKGVGPALRRMFILMNLVIASANGGDYVLGK
jgi:uncharacterized membrane protein YphA (DoxX/SURF4 family)